MQNAAESTEVTREITIAAAPEIVWTYLVDEGKAARWMGQTAELDARPGGIYRVQVLPGHTARGRFVELDPPRRLVYTWGPAAAARSQSKGWDHYLPRLITAAQGTDPGRDPWLEGGA